MNMELVPVTHLAYVVIGVGLTIWVARTLRTHGRVFLARGCKGDNILADALSHLLYVGFYLLHIGCLLLTISLGSYATTHVAAIEVVSTKIGIVLIVLAISHFFHLVLYARIHGKPTPPVAYGAPAHPAK